MVAHRVALGLIVCLCAGCGAPLAPATKATVEVSKVFLEALSALKMASDLYSSFVSESVQPTRETLAPTGEKAGVKIDLPTIAATWEERWKKVDAQSDVLEKRFQEVGAASSRYWEKLTAITTEIRDQGLRDSESAKNEQAKAEWNKAYENAKAQIAKVKELRDKGHDFHRLLLGAALRRQIAVYTETLNSIADEASSLLKELEVLTAQGKSLVNG